MKSLIPAERIERRIYLIRGHKVMLDRDLAEIYGVSTSRLNEQVKRNLSRFPDDFMFRLTKEEMENWVSQIATSNSWAKMGFRIPPHAFTEHGAVMLASVLNSPVAVEASIQVVRAFVKLRAVLASHQELAAKLESIERHLASHDADLGTVAGQLRTAFKAIHRLMEPRRKPRKPIGFQAAK